MTPRTPVLLFALLASGAGCMVASPEPRSADSAVRVEIAPYAIHETCLELAAGERIDWRFESDGPVQFNIHYHDGPSVVMPVSRDASTGDSGIFVALTAQDYCAMWEAGAGGAVVDYRVRPIGAAR